MNNTNRGLNRLFVIAVGLIVIGLGATAILVGAVPAFASGWRTYAPEVRTNVDSFIGSLTAGAVEWGWIIIVAILVLLAIVLLAFVFRQGHGHTARFMRDEATEHGTTIIDSRVAEQALQQALDGRAELVASHVSTYLVKKTPVLKVSATAQRGVSPTEVVHFVETMIASLERLLGRDVPASIQVGGGFRSRTTSSTRLR